MKKVLVVGTGSIGTRHVEVLKELFPWLKVAVLKRSIKTPEHSISKHIDYFFTDIDEALAFQADFAIVANPSSKHLEFAFPLAESGVHLLIEKPISSCSEGVDRLIELCEEKSIVLAVGYNLRFLPSMQMLKKYIQQGTIGKPLSVRAEVGQYLPGWRPDISYKNSASASRELGGGVLLELSHEIDYLTWLFGDIEWVKGHVSKQSELEIDVEDTAHVILGFSQASTNKQLVASLNLDFIRQDTTRRCVVIGDRGSLIWDGVAGKVEFYPQGGDRWVMLQKDIKDKNFTYREEIGAFAKAIEGSESCLASGKESLAVLKVIEAIRRSSNPNTIEKV